MDLDKFKLNKVDPAVVVSAIVNTCGPLFSFALSTGKTWLIHRHCCLVPQPEWFGFSQYDVPDPSTPLEADNKTSSTMAQPAVSGPFIVVRDAAARESPSSYSSVSGSEAGNGDNYGQSNANNGNGAAWIFSELELAVEASPPYIIVDSIYADEVAKNIYRGSLCRVFSVVGSLAATAMAFDLHTLPVAVPTISMTAVTATFYGFCYLRDPTLRYTVLGRKWRADGFQLSPEHFLYADQQPPLVLKAANSRFRKVLRVMPVILPVVATGFVLWRVWKVLS